MTKLTKVRVLFAGSPHVAVPTLQALVDANSELVGVLTQPAQPVGRKRVLTATPVEDCARKNDIPVFTPRSSAEVLNAVKQCVPDVVIVVAYGRLLDQDCLDAVPQGWWNIHFSLLPRWRGAAPVPHAIRNGDSETGLTLFRIDSGLDTGDIAMTRSHRIDADDTTGTLLAKLAERAPEMALELVSKLASHEVELAPQSGEASYAPKPDPDSGAMGWSATGHRVYEQFRSVTPEPGAYGRRDDTGDRVKILAMHAEKPDQLLAPGAIMDSPGGVLVGTGTYPLVVDVVQPAGKKPMEAKDWLRGLAPGVGFHA